MPAASACTQVPPEHLRHWTGPLPSLASRSLLPFRATTTSTSSSQHRPDPLLLCSSSSKSCTIATGTGSPSWNFARPRTTTGSEESCVVLKILLSLFSPPNTNTHTHTHTHAHAQTLPLSLSSRRRAHCDTSTTWRTCRRRAPCSAWCSCRVSPTANTCVQHRHSSHVMLFFTPLWSLACLPSPRPIACSPSGRPHRAKAGRIHCGGHSGSVPFGGAP